MEQEKKRKRSDADDGPTSDAEDDAEDDDDGIYNAEAMHDKLEDIAWTQQQPWIETLAITSSAPTHVANIDDDLERELAFYNQALGSAQVAIKRMEEGGIPWRRPPDYFAEMVKSDEHMAKVKEQLLHEQNVIEGAEQRRKQREAKKFGKQVAAERKKERAQEKKKAITSVSALRKQRERDGFSGDLDMDAELAKMDGRGGGKNAFGKNSRKSALGDRFTPSQKAGKRANRDSKYGFGGPKRVRKQNDAYSAAGGDYKSSSKSTPGSGNKKGRGKQQRPGKSRRAAMQKTRG
jgi:rRNA-processing protein EBP2